MITQGYKYFIFDIYMYIYEFDKAYQHMNGIFYTRQIIFLVIPGQKIESHLCINLLSFYFFCCHFHILLNIHNILHNI